MSARKRSGNSCSPFGPVLCPTLKLRSSTSKYQLRVPIALEHRVSRTRALESLTRSSKLLLKCQVAYANIWRPERDRYCIAQRVRAPSQRVQNRHVPGFQQSLRYVFIRFRIGEVSSASSAFSVSPRLGEENGEDVSQVPGIMRESRMAMMTE